ncbi:GDSL-type esterase/lipase family protein [Sabulibacter ruber]|uniref:GDSL-type esterase/lipase family protein n=1 Tax=Sabulibacter ruber TaxID=2811901 RepID=UPI001A963214|nr:GDSL-type esterase/lipase family protein [Sabulibacter ruber]
MPNPKDYSPKMKIIIYLFCATVLIFFNPSWAQQPNPKDSARNVTTTPVPRTDDYLKTEYPDMIADLNGRVDLSKVQVVFVGNSITMQWKSHGYAIWEPYFNIVSSPYYALNLGVSGDRTQHVLYRLLPKSQSGMGNLDNAAIDPKVIVLEIGTNHLWSDSVDQIVLGIKACVERLLVLRPKAKLLLLSVMPVSDPKINQRVDLVNKELPGALKLSSEMMRRFTYLNTNPYFRKPTGETISGYFTDGVHLTPSGYQRWFNLITPTLDSLLTTANNIKQFSITSCSHTGVAADFSKPLSITFNQPVDRNSLTKIVITKGGAYQEPIGADVKPIHGKWTISADPRTIVFQPSKSFEPGMFVSITLPKTFRSASGSTFENGKDIISFITENGTNYGHTDINIGTVKVVDDNVIPMIIRVPKKSGKHPVLIFVHGGGWTGGTPTQSYAALPTGYTPSYLADKLGVAVVGVAYRCIGSDGNFTKAKQDVEDAVRYVKSNADKYNLDTTRIAIGGESAGAPLSALIAQQDPAINYYIGINGIYDFVKNNTARFGQGNDFGQQTPSASANSAISHIKSTTPETLLIHGNKDITISHIQSAKFSEAIKSAGGTSYLRIFDGQPHWDFYAPGGKYEISTLYQVKDFLIKVMKLDVR